MVKKVRAAEQWGEGFGTTEYLAATLLDQAWHRIPADAVITDVATFEREALRDAGIAHDLIPPRYRSTYFQHIFAGGYSAGYYSYIWSEVLDAETVEWFKENDGLTPGQRRGVPQQAACRSVDRSTRWTRSVRSAAGTRRSVRCSRAPVGCDRV